MSTQQEGGNDENTELKEDTESNTQNEEKKEDEQAPKVSILLTISRCQFFIIKNDERNQLASGTCQLITDEPDRNELLFLFPDYPKISHKLSITKKRPSIKMCHSDYIFMNDSTDSFGLYIDTTQQPITQQFEQLISIYSHFKVSSKQFPIHQYPINAKLSIGPPDKIAIAGMKLSSLICKGSVATAKTIRRATLISTKSINKSKRYLKDKIQPNEEETKISPRVQSCLAKGQIGGKAVVKVSGAVLTGAIAAANVLSNEVTEAVSKTSLGQKISSESGPKSQAAKEIVKSTVAGVYTIYDELVGSGLHLVQTSSHATAEVLGHKYGDEVHRAAESTADIVDSAANTVVNVNMLGYKALAKRIAANSTVDVLSNEVERKENQSQRVGLNPMAAMQGLVIANNLNNELEQNKVENRKKRQEYVGIESVEEGDNNYKMAQDQFVMLNDMSLQSDMSNVSNMSGPNNHYQELNQDQNVKDKGAMDYDEDILDLD